MPLSLDNIRKARDAGYDDDQILESIERRDKEFGGRIKKARKAGYDSSTIMSSIENRLNQVMRDADYSPKVDIPHSQEYQLPQEDEPSFPGTQDQISSSPVSNIQSDQRTPATTLVNSLDTPKAEDYSYASMFTRGLAKSVSGKIAHPSKKTQEHIKSDPGFWSSLVEEAGTITGDMPYIMAGATLGAAMGGTLGSYGGPSGTAIGGILGGGFGSMALPEFLKSSIQEYKDYVEQGHDLTFGEFLERANRVGSKTLNSGIMGSILGMVNKSAPVLKKIPGIGKLFSSKIAQSAEKVATEAAVLTAVPAISQGRLPDNEDFAKSVALILGMKVAGLPYKVRERIEQSRVQGETPENTARNIEKDINELFMGKETVSKTKVSELAENLPDGNKKNLALRAIEKQQVRTPEQLENFLEEYDTIYPGIQGKTVKDRNRKFINKISEKNTREVKQGVRKDVPVPKMSESEKFKRAQLELREAKRGEDQQAIKKAQKKRDLQKERLKRENLKKKDKGSEAQKKVKEFESKVESKETKKIQNKIDSIEAQLKKAKKKGKESSVRILQKNLSIQKKRLKKAKEATEFSVPQTPKEVNAKQPTLVAENPESIDNPNVVKAVSEKPVETLSKGMYFPESRYTNAIKKTKRGIRGAVKYVFDKSGQRVLKANPESGLYKKGWESIKEYIGERNVRRFKNYKKWDESIVKNKKISKQDREDMIFYRERTGNPFIKGDTFEALEKRMSPESKKVVDTVVDNHMKEALEAMNDAPFIKQKVTPRKEVEDIYIRHMYAGKIDSNKVDAAYEAVQKRFKTDNPFANKRTYITFNEALQKAGLVPKYRDITQFLAAQDAIMTRVMSNNKLVHDLRNIEADIGTKFIVRSNNKDLYDKAKKDGWVPFQDAYMRSYVVGKNKKGKLKWAVTEAPALVHPDMASSLQGVFSKDAYKPDNAVLRLYDQVTSSLNKVHVGGSLFHFNALGESLTAKGGFLTSIARKREWWRQGTNLLNDVPYMEDAIKHGVKIHLPTHAELSQVDTFYKDFLRRLQASPNNPLRGIANLADVKGPLSRVHKYLFTEWQPRMKIVQYENYVQRMLNHFEKKGMYPNEQLLKEIKEQAASAVNDQFGGQNWELIPFFNDPKNRKNLQRFIAFPDWTVSAIREISQAVSSENPIRRRLGQRYIAEYLLGLGFGTQLLSYSFTGLENGPDGKVRWNPKKAHSTFENEDQKRRGFFDIQMPDIYFTVAGQKVNMGRDESGRQYFVHAGKKFKEIERYFHSPVSALFSKSTPLVQNAMKFTMDYTPSEEGIFPVRGAYVEGEFRPWDGSQKWTKDRAASVVKEILGSSLPYSLQTAVSDFFDSKETWAQALARIGLKTLGSGGGALSVGKGISLRSSEPYWEKAFRIENKSDREESLKALRVLLKGYGYKDRQIKSIETKIRRRVEGKAERR